jgi:hypothetical protein
VQITMQTQRAYMCFYLEGRADEESDPIISDDDSLDIDKLAEKTLAGGQSLRDILTTAVTALAAPLDHGTDKREWLDDHKKEIKLAGGDAEAAHKHYLQGIIDEAIYTLEGEVVESMFEEENEDDEDEDEDEEDDQE